MAAHGFLAPLVLLFLAALVAAYVLHRLRQPPLIGFLLAGTLLGPHGLRLVGDVGTVETFAEVGIVLLLFTVGLELSLPNLRRLGRVVWGAGPIQLLGTIALVVAAETAFGYDWRRSLFLGFLVALSSTAVLLKLLVERQELDSPHGRLLVGVLIFQDLAVVPMMLAIAPLSGQAGTGTAAALVGLAKMGLAVTLLIFVARRVVPRILKGVVGTRQKELFVVAVLFLVLGTALATSWAGLSLSLGAFLAGLILSESEYGHQALADISSFRDAFSALFFVSIGMLFDPRILITHPLPVVEALLLVLVGKSLVGAVPVLLLGYGIRVATVVGLSLAQIGEFSFALLRQGQAANLILPATYQTFLAAAIVTMMMTPWLSEVSHRLGRILVPGERASTASGGSPARPDSLVCQDHVIVLGFGHMGETLARVLARAKVAFRVIDLNPERVRRGRARSIPIEYGDVTSDIVLRRAGIEQPRAAIVLLSDPRATRHAVRNIRALSPGLFLLVRTRYLNEIPELTALGADDVVAEEFETALEIAGRALRRLGLSLPWVEAETDEIRQARHDAFRRFRVPGGSPEGVRRALGGTRVELVSVGADWFASGRSLGELDLRAAGGANVLAVVRDGTAAVSPGGSFVLQASDQVLLLGTDPTLEKSVGQLRGSV